MQIARRAYIRSHCFEIYGTSVMSKVADATDRSVLVTPGMILLHPDEEDEDRDEGLDRVRPPSE